tara:strand:- start:1342 stop:2106 length:765 start_codon:yes stop_codon:yes gene_type:complete
MKIFHSSNLYDKKVFFLGGLGNQLWICAYAYIISEKFKIIKLDNSWYENEAKIFFNPKRVQRISYLKILKKISKDFVIYSSPLSLIKFQLKNKFNFLYRKTLNKKEDFFEIYYQDPKYISENFINRLVDILIEVYFKNKNKKDFNENFIEYYALHIRLGDRGELDFFEINYLKSILNKIDKKISIRIFSDDYEEAYKILKKYKFHNFINSNSKSELDDFIEMSFSKEIFFLRESTFSFWAKKISSRIRLKVLNF